MLRRLILLLLLALPASAKEPDAIARLTADLKTGESATVVLTRWCGTLKLASPPVVKAIRAAEQKPATAEIRRLLHAGPGDPVGYRKVNLTCGGHVLSEADNWYLPSRLTPAMNQALAGSDTPFGTVVRPLNFHRKTLGMRRQPADSTILEVRALLLTEGGTPFSLVVEDYKPVLVAP